MQYIFGLTFITLIKVLSQFLIAVFQIYKTKTPTLNLSCSIVLLTTHKTFLTKHRESFKLLQKCFACADLRRHNQDDMTVPS